MCILKIGCKITTIYAYSQIKCTKSADLCTHWANCAMNYRRY